MFVVLDFASADTSVGPYSQAAREVDGWYLEVVNDLYLPRSAWPLDELGLRRSGWLAPADGLGNWWRLADEDTEPTDLVRLLLGGLRDGRPCPAEGEFRITVGTSPTDPDDGEPLPLSDLGLAA
jgi:hypothetical protein